MPNHYMWTCQDAGLSEVQTHDLWFDEEAQATLQQCQLVYNLLILTVILNATR